MAKKLAKLLMADINATSDLAEIAKMLQSKGRGNDTILAHITKREAERLKRDGGSGTINPETGLLEFDDYGSYSSSAPTFGDYSMADTATAPMSQEQIQQQLSYQQPVSANVYSNIYESPETSGFGGYGGTGTSPYINPPQGKVVSPINPQGDVVPQQTALGTVVEGEPSVSGSYTGGGLSYGGYTGLQRPSAADYGVQIPASARAVPQLPASSGLGYGVTDTLQPAVAADQAAPATKPWYDKISTTDLVRLGLAGGLGLYGASQTKKAAEQQKQAMEEQKNLAAPYQAQGKELVRAAQAGELTPAAAQSYQALQARLAQGAESRGGVGAAQSAAQAEAYRQQLLQGQYDYGLKVSNIGDNIAIGAIRTGMQADQQLNQANSSFYTNLAMIGAGIPMYTSRG